MKKPLSDAGTGVWSPPPSEKPPWPPAPPAPPARRPHSRVRVCWAFVGAGPVPRRVAALLAAPIATRPLPVYLTAALLVATGSCGLESVNDLHTLLKLAHHSQ